MYLKQKSPEECYLDKRFDNDVAENGCWLIATNESTW